MDFDRVSDADQRLRNMLGLWKGKYVQISAIEGRDGGNITAYFSEIPSGKKGYDVLSSGNFNFSCFNTGYTLVKDKNAANNIGVYIFRKPVRTTRQGLDHRNVYLDPISQTYYNTETLVYNNDLSKLLLGVYEFDRARSINNAFTEAEEFDERYKYQYPLSRNFAIKASTELHGDVLLVRRGEVAGKLQGDKYVLSKPYDFCKEELEREGLA